MVNAIIISRARYDYLNERANTDQRAFVQHPFKGFDFKMIQMIDYFFVEEVDGGAVVLKNRYDGRVGRFSPADYVQLKEKIYGKGI